MMVQKKKKKKKKQREGSVAAAQRIPWASIIHWKVDKVQNCKFSGALGGVSSRMEAVSPLWKLLLSGLRRSAV